MEDEPIMDVAHLGHVGILTPKPDESLRFFVDVLGMTESGRQGDSVFLRGWDDYERYSLKLTGFSHLRSWGTRRSGRAARRRCNAGSRRCRTQWPAAVGWHEGELGHGPAYQFHDPDGHLLETLLRDRVVSGAPENLRPVAEEPGAALSRARGVNVRRIDHFNCLATDVIRANREFFEQHPGLSPDRADRAR